MSCLTHIRSRDGFALPVALLAMMVIGALVTGGFYLSARDGRASTRGDLGEQALYVAEYGVDQVLGTWVRDSLVAAISRTEARGDLGATAVRTISGMLGHYTLRVERLGQGLALVRSLGAVQQGPARATREVGAVVRTTGPRLPYPAALTVLGAVALGEGVRVDGAEAGTLDCPPPHGAPGLRVRDSVRVSRRPGSELAGSPAMLQVPTMTVDSLADFGMAGIGDLVASATKAYEDGARETAMGPVTAAGPERTRCDTSVRRNWGDPLGTGPCAGYRPVIHARGDLTLDGGSGQGILVVDGDLRAVGGVRFSGVVFVGGSLETAGGGNRFEGAVLVNGDARLDADGPAPSLVQFSACRVDRVLNSSVRIRPLASRSWLDLSAVEGNNDPRKERNPRGAARYLGAASRY